MRYDAVFHPSSKEHCFACGRRLGKAKLVDTRDGQAVYVGPECYERVLAAGDKGYQPARGGPRLWQLCEVRS